MERVSIGGKDVYLPEGVIKPSSAEESVVAITADKVWDIDNQVAEINWRELRTRDNDRISLQWGEVTGQFRVVVDGEETPPLPTLEAADDVFNHYKAQETLGKYVLVNYPDVVLGR